jgi:YHS domain-containing protein
MTVKTLLIASGLAFALLAPVAARAAKAPIYTSLISDVAVSGHDPVAYFTQGRPVKGDARFSTTWSGATWRFATAANLAAFRADPARYAPQFGGYCAWAVSQGYTASADPTVWKVVGGKLYLNYSRSIGQRWEQDVPGNIRKAEANWPGVLAR